MTSHDLQGDGEGPRADRPKRRHFSDAYKPRMVEEYDAAPPGEKGAFCRSSRAFFLRSCANSICSADLFFLTG
jgi:hypothetical protein